MENNERELSTESMIEMRDEERDENDDDDHNNSQTRRTRNMENASARGRLSGRRRRDAGGTQGRRRHCFVYGHTLWAVGVELV